MPVFRLPTSELVFPHPSLADKNGLLAIGGLLSKDSILLAYQNGIFPWNNQDEELLWWCLTPRMVLYPKDIQISKSMRQLLKKEKVVVRLDTNFQEVMEKCAAISRKNQEESWIHSELKRVFVQLFELGFAHSVEVYKDDRLVGGLYGLLIGKMFCGESMFSERSNMSKIALIKLCQKLETLDVDLIDCQQVTAHLQSMGAVTLSKQKFFQYLESNKKNNIKSEHWRS